MVAVSVRRLRQRRPSRSTECCWHRRVVLAAYGSTYASPYDLFRPLATLTLSAAFLFALLGGATRRWHAAAAPTTSVHPTRPSPTWFRTLFAARGHSFPDDVTTREVFPALLGL